MLFTTLAVVPVAAAVVVLTAVSLGALAAALDAAHRYDRKLDWSWWQHVVGNEFTWFGLALLVTTAVVSSPRRTPAAGRVPVPRS
jgi:alpha-1,2-mannosyltransferase